MGDADLRRILSGAYACPLQCKPPLPSRCALREAKLAAFRKRERRDLADSEGRMTDIDRYDIAIGASRAARLARSLDMLGHVDTFVWSLIVDSSRACRDLHSGDTARS